MFFHHDTFTMIVCTIGGRVHGKSSARTITREIRVKALGLYILLHKGLWHKDSYLVQLRKKKSFAKSFRGWYIFKSRVRSRVQGSTVLKEQKKLQSNRMFDRGMNTVKLMTSSLCTTAISLAPFYKPSDFTELSIQELLLNFTWNMRRHLITCNGWPYHGLTYNHVRIVAQGFVNRCNWNKKKPFCEILQRLMIKRRARRSGVQGSTVLEQEKMQSNQGAWLRNELQLTSSLCTSDMILAPGGGGGVPTWSRSPPHHSSSMPWSEGPFVHVHRVDDEHAHSPFEQGRWSSVSRAESESPSPWMTPACRSPAALHSWLPAPSPELHTPHKASIAMPTSTLLVTAALQLCNWRNK